jgi:O-antigen/teichoic acid export membrane protein
LLRWLALAAPLIVLSRLYFTHLRVQKQIGHLVLLSGIVAAATLGVAAVLMPRLGIAANGVGLLVGHSLVAAVASGRWMRQNGPGSIIRRVGTVSNIRLWR